MAIVLNVLGLSVAFAAFMVIMEQVRHEWTFEDSHPQAQHIFRADIFRGDGEYAIHARPLVDAVIAASPRIETGTLINPFLSRIYVTVGEGEEKQGFRERFVTCYPDITRIFGFSFVEGDAACLNDPEKVMIPLSMARRMFAGQSAVGETLLVNEFLWTKEQPKTLTIGGVYRDFPENTQLNNVIYTAIDRTMASDWQSSNFICYLLLNQQEEAAKVEAEINQRLDFSPVWNPNSDKLSIRLTPITDIYLAGDAAQRFGGIFKVGNENTVRILFGIALLIVLIAGINFTNFSIALAPARVKSINTQKILGSSTKALRGTLLSEALVTTFVSWLVAMGIVGVLNHYRLLSFIEADLSFPHHLPIALATGLIALATGLLAGLYPAWYVTSFQPAMALKGNFALSSSGRTLRILLVGFQYVISIGLIVAAGFVQLQNNYMRTYNQGFDKDQVAIVEMSGSMYRNSKDAYVNGLKEYPGIEDVAFSRLKIGAADTYTQYGLKYKDATFGCYVLEVSHNFMQVMGISIREGRDFLPSDEQPGAQQTYIFNQSLYKELSTIGLKPGDLIEMTSWGNLPGRVAGIAGDVKITSLRKETDYVTFLVNSPYPLLPISFIRLKAGTNIPEAVKHIRQTLASIDPAYPFDIEFYDQVYDRLYRKEEYLNKAISLLSLLAILISVMGVFGLVLFETQHRRKEIGIRKVHGATLGEILGMFNKVYFRIVCICFVVAAPVAWYGIGRWLENFAYRTPLYWWVFAAAFALIALVTFITVSVQSRQAANANPVDSIRTE
jgi:putative ABC transport system permease protein